MILQGYQRIDIGAVQSYVTDLQNIFNESEVAQKKGFPEVIREEDSG